MKKEKRFVIRKYVMAQDALSAIKKEKKIAVDDVWIDNDWMKENLDTGGRKIGYRKK